MNRGGLFVFIKLVSSLFAANLVQSAPAGAAAATTEKAACDLTKARVAARGHIPTSVIAFCDFIVPEAQPSGFYVLGLHGKRDDCANGTCSTLMGWFAVEKLTGKVFEWDINDDRPIRQVTAPK